MHHYYSKMLCLFVNSKTMGIFINYTTDRIIDITIKGKELLYVTNKTIRIIFHIHVKTVNLFINLSYPSNCSSIYPFHKATKCRHKKILKCITH